MNDKELNIRQCLDVIFGRLLNGETFSGLELKRWVVQLNPRYAETYPDTILRSARKYHRSEFAKYEARKSIYIVTKS